MIDLRSDTITRPTAPMRRVMAEAVVGDDVLGDDPTVLKLESVSAELLGKEAAMFVPSGTMANQLAIRTHTQHGDEILLDATAHIYWYEGGAPAALSGVNCRVLTGTNGLFTAEQLKNALRPDNIHYAPSRLVALENTHNRGGGSIWPMPQLLEVCKVAREAGLALHLDGARLWNASVATGISESDYAAPFDSVSVCFSKGLGAPVGSVLAGSSNFIQRARRFRKQFGGGMRQSGILAAAALYAIEHHRNRLLEDHENARLLAEGLERISGLRIDKSAVVTNMVYIHLENLQAVDAAARLETLGVRVLATGPQTLRAVTSLEVDQAQIHEATGLFAELMRG